MEEKTPEGVPRPLPAWTDPGRHTARRRRFRAGALLLGLLALAGLTHLRVSSRTLAPDQPPRVIRDDDPMNPWESITPSPNLTWHSCYTFVNPRFLCARLSLPMDHLPPAATEQKVHVAVLLLPALTDAEKDGAGVRKQPLLLNPGGPGGSGTLLALLAGPAIQTIVGGDRPIIGFDPRGVPFTTPGADCWSRYLTGDGCEIPSSGLGRPSSGSGARRGYPRGGAATHSSGGGDGLGLGGVGQFHGKAYGEGGCEDVAGGWRHRLEWERENAGYGLINGSDVALRFLDVGHRGVNTLCREKDRQMDGSVLRWAGTQEVARDMAGIVDAWERWIEKKGGKLEAEMKGKLVYWGFSYGTYLGATFARLFPDRVGRLLLDGVVDAEYYESPVWRESLVDTDKVLGSFFWYCVVARSRCDLYRNGDQPADVKRRYEAVMERLNTNPVTFTHPEHFYPVVLRVSLIKMLVFSILYQPIQGFPVLATLLNYIYEERYEVLGPLFQDTELLCSLSGNPVIASAMTDAQRAIMCSDKTQAMNMTLPELTSEYERMAGTSQFADIWMNLMLKCNNWDIPAGHAVPAGSWALPGEDGTADQIETANPILFLSNTYDPVTPLRAAVKMALKFKGAGLLEQMSQGHCTISTVSLCTAKIIKEYIASGKVPPPPTDVDAEYNGKWTRCGADQIPWGQSGADSFNFDTAEEKEASKAWQHVQRTMGRMQRWGAGEEKGLDMEVLMQWA